MLLDSSWRAGATDDAIRLSCFNYETAERTHRAYERYLPVTNTRGALGGKGPPLFVAFSAEPCGVSTAEAENATGNSGTVSDGSAVGAQVRCEYVLKSRK